jgi:chorismate synthase
MSSQWGKNLRMSIFGESHGKAIGVVLDGLPSGFPIDEERILFEMKRRQPGNMPWSTKRKEADLPEIVSGAYEGKTTGTPLCAMIRNTDTRSKDYSVLASLYRPSHADYSGSIRYDDANDPRGGGHFSGRLTAPMVFAGALIRPWLEAKNIRIFAQIRRIGGLGTKPIDTLNPDELQELAKLDFAVSQEWDRKEMIEAIEEARLHEDSLGGAVELMITGLPAGMGNPIFDTVEGNLAQALFGIPAVKAVEFGDGCEFSELTGSQAADEMRMDGDEIVFLSNHNGGIVGGITTGAPLRCRVTFKPTPSISQPLKTVTKTGQEKTLALTGRHDPCIVPRAVPVVEAVAAMVMADLILGGGEHGDK